MYNREIKQIHFVMTIHSCLIMHEHSVPVGRNTFHHATNLTTMKYAFAP